MLIKLISVQVGGLNTLDFSHLQVYAGFPFKAKNDKKKKKKKKKTPGLQLKVFRIQS